MLHNRVKETTTSTGSGNITLAGAVTNYRTFNTAFGTSRRFFYWIIDDTNNVWETGIGYLSASTTLVRDVVTNNSSGTTSALTLSAGTKDVICEQNFISAYASVDVNDDATNRAVFDTDSTETNSAWSVGTASEVGYVCFNLTIGGWYSGIIAEVVTAQASSTARFGLYSLVHGRPDKKLEETGSIDTSTTGKKTGTFSANIHLNCGWWALALISTDTLVDWRAHPTDSARGGPFGQDFATDIADPNKMFYHSGSGIVLPTTATATGTMGREAVTLGLIHV